MLIAVLTLVITIVVQINKKK
ncbi:hypothetical protein AB3N04_13645 [Alkalihalophilus sp. As8PL]|uniref:Holin-like toxin n=1 Tax=Alkalihalophilus sp. As8PL TaxID=3237103 RepID=A0AB39BYT1_9BACI